MRLETQIHADTHSDTLFSAKHTSINLQPEEMVVALNRIIQALILALDALDYCTYQHQQEAYHIGVLPSGVSNGFNTIGCHTTPMHKSLLGVMVMLTTRSHIHLRFERDSRARRTFWKFGLILISGPDRQLWLGTQTVKQVWRTVFFSWNGD